MPLSAVIIGKTASDDIASASYNWAPTKSQQFCESRECYAAMNCVVLVLNWVLRSHSLQSVLVYNFTKMHAMSYRSGFFTCSCTVNSWEPAVSYTATILSAFFQVGIPSFLRLTAMSDSKSLNTSSLDVIIFSKNKHVFIHDLSDLTLQIIFNARWASMNVGSKWPIAWKRSRHAPSWRLFLHCGIEETGSPGSICIVCHQVLHHPSEHETSSMGKHSLPKSHITKWNKLTESEVTELTSSTVNETALAILKRQGSQGITIVSSQSQIIFDIQVIPYWLKWETIWSKLAAKDFETSEFHQDTWIHYLTLGFLSAHIPWNPISNLDLRPSYKALHDGLVQPSTTTLSNICQREYALTVDAIKKLWLSLKKVSLALDGWTSTNKLAITSVITYYMDRNWALREAQPALHEVDHLFFSPFER